MSNQNEQLIDTKEVIRRLRISRTTLYALIERGQLIPVEDPRAFLRRRAKLEFRESDVQRLIDEGASDSEEPGPANRVSGKVA